jgi:hypothetical protein
MFLSGKAEKRRFDDPVKYVVTKIVGLPKEFKVGTKLRIVLEV